MQRDWLREKRLNLDLSQEQLATKLGITRAYYTQIELGNRRPSPEIAIAIGKELNFPWTDFFE